MEKIVKDFLDRNDCFYLKKHFKNAKQSSFMNGVMLTNPDGMTVTVNKQLFTDNVINVYSSEFNESYIYDTKSKSFMITKENHSFFRN